MSVEQIRVHVWVSGRVQGVGFRAFVASAAGRMGVTGWVRNVGYETVETVAEGSRPQVEQFVELVNFGPRSSRIDERRMEIETYAAEFADFQIRSSR